MLYQLHRLYRKVFLLLQSENETLIQRTEDEELDRLVSIITIMNDNGNDDYIHSHCPGP